MPLLSHRRAPRGGNAVRAPRALFAGALFAAAIGINAGVACSSVETEPSGASSVVTTGNGGSAGSTVVTSTGGGIGGSGSGGAGGAGGTSSAGGAGGTPITCTPDSGGDTCPGDLIALTLGTTACYEGDLAAATADYSAKYCSSANDTTGPDRVYHLTFSEVGTLKFVVKAIDADFNPTLHGRRLAASAAECANPNQEFSCWSFFPTKEGFAIEVDPAQIPEAYLFVDGAIGVGGKYRIDVSYTKPACGDGVVNASVAEECDDGNAASGDGCDKTCKLEKVTVFDACPGEPFPLALNQTLTFNSNTAPYKDGDGIHSYHPLQVAGCGTTAYKSTAPDRVYQLKAKANGTVTATVGLDLTGTIPVCDQDLLDPGCWARVLYAVEAVDPATCGASCTCDTGMTIVGDPLMGAQLGTQLACSNKGLYDVEDISFPVQKDRTYFIVVDGNSYAQKKFGPYNLKVSLK